MKDESSFEKYRRTCKSCRNKYKSIKWNSKKKEKDSKKCIKCNKTKSIQKFYKNRNSCKQCVIEQSKKYRNKNKSKRNKQIQQKRIEDEFYNFKLNMRRFISYTLRKKGYTKSEELHFKDVVGLSVEELKVYLENNKYGFTLKDKVDVDHIIPLAKAKTFKEVLKLNHYTNLQLLPSYYNQNIKSDKKWDKNHFENWLKKVEKNLDN